MNRSSLAFLALLGLALGACGGGSEVTGPAPADVGTLESDLFAVVDAEDAFASIQDATLDSEMAFHQTFGDPDGFVRHPRHPRGAGSHLGSVLRDLNLSGDQLFEILRALRSHRMSIRSALEGLRAANRELIAQANAERRVVIERLHAGEITAEEARSQLREISQRTRDAIRGNVGNTPFLEQVCASREELFDRIRGLLDEEQVPVWDAWVAGLDGPCV